MREKISEEKKGSKKESKSKKLKVNVVILVLIYSTQRISQLPPTPSPELELTHV